MFTQEEYRVYNESCPIMCDCGAVIAFENLVPGKVQEILDPAHVVWQSRHYHCPSPKCKIVLVYSRGDGSPLELVHGVELPPDYSI